MAATFAPLTWGKEGEKLYHTGVDRGVVWVQNVDGTYKDGAAWNGLTAVNESPSGAEPTDLWADNKKYLSLRSAEQFGFTIEAYMSPEEFDACDGSAYLVNGSKAVKIHQQTRSNFAFSWRTILGNDLAKDDYGHIIHIAYGCSANPSPADHATVNDSPEAATMSWECTTTAIEVAGFKPTAHIEIDTTKMSSEQLTALEKLIYGSNEANSKCPTLAEIAAIFSGTPGAAG